MKGGTGYMATYATGVLPGREGLTDCTGGLAGRHVEQGNLSEKTDSVFKIVNDPWGATRCFGLMEQGFASTPKMDVKNPVYQQFQVPVGGSCVVLSSALLWPTAVHSWADVADSPSCAVSDCLHLGGFSR